jgi:hypothetical protein
MAKTDSLERHAEKAGYELERESRFVVATADSPTVPWLPARRDNQ